ncbi:MAG: four helix bundle protein [candidate division NC10 bacterium]|nr:four helix bundle protein [candidate division NC10 bacterium]
MKRVEDLDVFKLSHALALEIYKLTSHFPKDEMYGLVSQMRRAATAVSSNLVEGAGRNSRAEYRHFVGVAKGSAGEIRYQLLLATDLGYLSREEGIRLQGEYGRVMQMLTKLIRSLGSEK